jgi:hypothetical protein
MYCWDQYSDPMATSGSKTSATVASAHVTRTFNTADHLSKEPGSRLL